MAKLEGIGRELLRSDRVRRNRHQGEMARTACNWGGYRALGIGEDTLVFPAGHYVRTEQNLRRNNRIELLVASKSVRGTHGPGHGCLIRGTGEIVTEGEVVARVKAKFPWARGALIVQVEEVQTQL